MRVDAGMLPAGGQVFALIVTGDSMIEDGIHDGDTLFVKQQKNVRDGDIAVVRVDDDATVKRFFRGRLADPPAACEFADGTRSTWTPASGEIEVIGIAVGVWRRL